MQDAVHNFSGTISINGRENSNLRFADDIDLIAGTEEDLQELTTLERRACAYGMEISAEKSKIMVNSRIAPKTSILMNRERLEEATSFKYLGSIISSEGDFTEEIRTQINLATSAITRLKKIRSNNNIKTVLKIRLYKSLVVSVLTYGCRSWTLNSEPERRTATLEITFFRRILKISYKDHITNISVLQDITETAGPQEPLLATIKHRKFQWFGQTQHTCQKNTTRHGQRRQKTRKTTKNVHGQHSRVDRFGATGIMRCCPQPSQMEKDHCGSLQGRTSTIGSVKG